VSKTSEPDTSRLVRYGLLCAFISSMLYSLTNVGMRYLITLGAERSWILFMKEIICVVSVTLLIFWLALRGKYFVPKFRWIFYILVGGTACELFGAQLNLMSLELAGIIVCVPIIQSATMVFATFYGYCFLQEKLNRQMLTAIAILLTGIVCLVVSPKLSENLSQTQTANLTRAVPLTLILGGVWAVLGGMAYAVHIFYLRVSARSFQIPVTLIMLEVTGIGTIIFFEGFWRSHGYQLAALWENIPTKHWIIGLLTGSSNTVAFYFQITGLRYLIAARAQVIAIGQIVIGTLFGIFFFNEPTNLLLWLGMFLIVAGIVVVSFAKSEKK
jgi:drug/metabolite transporter (DMT)-like permease